MHTLLKDKLSSVFILCDSDFSYNDIIPMTKETQHELSITKMIFAADIKAVIYITTRKFHIITARWIIW